MKTETAGASPREKLDQMRHEGRISEAEYGRLVKSMTAASERCAPAGETETVGKGGPLRKHWKHGVIGGLCAGLARYLGTNERMFRVILAGTAFLLLFAWGAGLLVVIAYFVFCGLVPWDERETASAHIRSGRPLLFTVVAAALLVLLPLLFSALVLPKLELIYSDMGIEVWSSEFQGTFAGRAIDCASEYRQWLQIHDKMLFAGLGAAVLVTSFVGLVYCSLCKTQARKYFGMAVITLGAAWVLFLAIGSLMPLLGTVTAVR
jgi:phage shock protein PspC (stress-responsive transcriptional regulator)